MESNVTALPGSNGTVLVAEQEIRLRFVLGEFCLFTRGFRGMGVRAPFGAAPENMEQAAAGILREHACDVVYIPMVPVERQPRRLSWTGGTIRHCSRIYPLYYVGLTGTFDEYLTKFSSKTRKRMRRDLSKLQEYCGGELTLREYRQPDEMAEFQKSARAVSELTYQDRLLHAGLPDTAEFLSKLIEDAKADTIRCYVLFHGERPVSFRYCTARGRHLTLRITGYDPAYRDLAPGRVLLYLILERIFPEHRFDSLDFGQGEASHKSLFGTGSLRCIDAHYFRRTPRNVFYVLIHVALTLISGGLVRLFAAAGVKDRLKKWLRR